MNRFRCVTVYLLLATSFSMACTSAAELVEHGNLLHPTGGNRSLPNPGEIDRRARHAYTHDGQDIGAKVCDAVVRCAQHDDQRDNSDHARQPEDAVQHNRRDGFRFPVGMQREEVRLKDIARV